MTQRHRRHWRAGYGGDATFFLSLWRTVEPVAADDDPEKADAETLNDVTTDKAATDEWVEGGHPA